MTGGNYPQSAKILGPLAILPNASGSGHLSSGNKLLHQDARKQVENCTVSSMLTAIGQTIAMACNNNPTKIKGSNKLLSCLQVMLDGYQKEDPASIKKLPVQSDVPELLVTTAYNGMDTEKDKTAADLTLIAFYYLLRFGEYTVKGSRNSTKQTVQFKYEDVTFFRKNNRGGTMVSPTRCPGPPHCIRQQRDS
jgi:hypothetical protein